MATTTHDDGFQEIQLNGKQLVFLFMAVLVLSVGIFLLGFQVGRGVRLDRGSTAQAAEFEPGDQPAAPPVPDAVASNGTEPTSEPTTYSARLKDAQPGNERLSPPEPPDVKHEPVAEATRPAPAPPPTVAASTASAAPTPPAPVTAAATRATAGPAAPSAPEGPGIEIQLSAFRDRKGADALANRLIAMGFTAYIVPTEPGAPPLFRVRVGKFKDRKAADIAAARLKKEKFTPWIQP
jgi:cell division septation protein DedD